MSNLVITSPALATVDAAAEAVVKSDSSAAAAPSINVNVAGVTAKVVVGQAAAERAMDALEGMEQACRSWETNELAVSNKRLYSILQEAYSYYLLMKRDSDKNKRDAQAAALDKFIEKRGYTFMPSTHDMTRVVKCVFGMDRRRVSAYSIALREALRQNVSANDLIAFIEQNGGVEQIRMGGTKPLSATIRAGRVKEEVTSTELGMFKFDSRLLAADADWADKQVVIVATCMPTGEFQANAVIRHDTAVNAALAAFYSQRKAQEREQAKAERDAEKEAAAAKKQEAADAEKAKADKEAADKAHAQSLFEGSLV